jgi:hypothetical protein
MKSIAEMTQSELGAFVQTQLRKRGIDLVLSGGAVVSIYSNNRYVSKDLDFVNVYAARRKSIREAMEELGFHEEGRHFVHSDSQFIIEFPPGPLTIGEESVKQIDELEFPTGTLKIISPTDCVKDRLAAYYHWGDQQCLVQATLVAQLQHIDFEEVKRWSKVEGKVDDFEKISSRLRGEP